ncbi:MAG: Actin cross-linking toxin VgrG1 [Acinetobacter bereziniae]|uniref:Actin cross-linking toxin VgrG1 n=1 Tax=Acinetobacter bereziniae TaxID=106648 RepID=A0A833U9S6_ACIBZ|nr:MAG: Actin cross-linking toxin VgrG1 [Acinetobacter bereziniae]
MMAVLGSNDNDTDSAWVDVLTPWAGEGYGARFLPRKDEIVVIDFFDGNIDRPFVTGRIHEAQRNPTKFDVKGQLPDTKKLSGIRSKEVDGEGFNQLRFDDTTGQISTQLHSSHGATQLNLGNLSHPKEKAESDGRGEGFELRTDDWGGIRAPKGLLITTEEDGDAANHQMTRTQLESALLAAQSNNENIQELAKSHKAQEPDLELQKKINQDIPKWDGSDETPFIVLHSNDHFVVNSLKGTLIQSSDHIEISTNRNVQTYTGNNVLTNALGSISLFAQQKDIDIKAGHGNVNVQAQSGEMTLASQKLMHVYALDDLVKIESGKGILITSGGGYIKIEGGNIDIVCPGKISLKAGQICTMSGNSLNSELAQMPQAQASYDEQFIVRNRAGIAQPNVKYKIVTEDGKTITGVTDAEGKTQKISSLSMVKAELEILGKKDD